MTLKFSGYLQLWCPNGHYNELDIYDEGIHPVDTSSKPLTCKDCGILINTKNLVDNTNGKHVGRIEPVKVGEVENLIKIKVGIYTIPTNIK